ncbi:MAG: hypothetical protein GX891_02080 [Clostridiales bacterium]|nr:hypothetical protein [Clostridiales bacterium]
MEKRKIVNILRVIAYCIGFPLLFLITLITTMPFFGEPVYKDSCANGILIVLGMWAVVEIVRLSLKFALKDKKTLQAVIVGIVSVVVMAVPMLIMDAFISKDVDAVSAEAAQKKITVVSDYQVPETAEITTAKIDKFTTAYYADGVAFKVETDVSFKIENYNYQLGWFMPKTDRKDIGKSLYRVLLDDVDDFMDDHGINKWLNYEDYYFSNYKPTNGEVNGIVDGHLLGVRSTIDRTIKAEEDAIKAYNAALIKFLNGEAAEPTQTSVYKNAMGIDSTPEVPITPYVVAEWSLPELYKIQAELDTKAKLYPIFVAREYIYIFVGFVVFSTILVYLCNEKIAKLEPGDKVEFKFMNKFKKQGSDAGLVPPSAQNSVNKEEEIDE